MNVYIFLASIREYHFFGKMINELLVMKTYELLFLHKLPTSDTTTTETLGKGVQILLVLWKQELLREFL